MTDRLFDQTHRVFDRPRPVWVRVEWALSVGQNRYPRGHRGYLGVPLRVRAYGIDRSAIAPGELWGWYRPDDAGPWWGLVEFRATSANGRLGLDLRQLVPAHALTPRTTRFPPGSWTGQRIGEGVADAPGTGSPHAGHTPHQKSTP
ncbi:MAG: hypothetical protein ACRD2Z_09365 [Thermoanaerobaculia bacterium]